MAESKSREAGNYHVIQGGTWKVAKWEPSRFDSPIDGHWHIAGYRRYFLDRELDQIGPRILPPDLDDDLPRRYELQRAEYKLARERLMILANEALELEAKLKALFALMEPLTWPDDPYVDEWLRNRGYQPVHGAIGMVATAKKITP